MTDLVTRLRSTRMVDKGDRATFMVEVLRNIDGPEAADRIETLEARLLEAEVRAHKWMEAHDKLKAGKPYDFPKPADLPDALAEITRLQRELGNQPRVRMCEPKDE